MDNQTIPIACDLTAIPDAARPQHIKQGEQLFQRVQKVRQLPKGYAFVFDSAPGIIMALASFVENERRCCPFFTFTIEVTPGGGPVALQLTGDEDVKEFVRSAFSEILSLKGLFDPA